MDVIYPYDKRGSKYNPKPILYVEDKNGCWNCTSHALNKGYPVIRYNNRLYGGHQFSYLMYYGSLPNGLIVRHKCDNTKCINPPFHLELGTQKDNMVDCKERNRNHIPTPEEVRGEVNGHAILTEKEVVEIKHKLLNMRNGYRKELAKEYGVSEATIKSIRAKRNWGWLEVGIHDRV